MRERIKLPYDGLIGLLQGKEIHLLRGDDEIIISPPFDGVFLTTDQVRQIEYTAEMRVINMLQKVREYGVEHYVADIETLSE